MKGALQVCRSIPFNLHFPLSVILLIAAFTLSACGSQNETTGSSPQQGENVSIQIPDAAGKLDQTAGILTATISVNGGAPQAMTISGTS